MSSKSRLKRKKDVTFFEYEKLSKNAYLDAFKLVKKCVLTDFKNAFIFSRGVSQNIEKKKYRKGKM